MRMNINIFHGKNQNYTKQRTILLVIQWLIYPYDIVIAMVVDCVNVVLRDGFY